MNTRRFSILALTGAMVLGASAAQAGFITTMFTGGNNNAAGGGAYFDVLVGPNAITIKSFDVNTIAGTPANFGFRVFTKLGTSVGFETTAGAWTLASQGTGTFTAPNIANPVSLDTQFTLAANTLYGFALTHSGANGPSASQAYTNGNGSNQNFSNGDLSLSLGKTTNVLFTAPTFTPRVWNGTIHYNLVPEPASMLAMGAGIAALVARRRRRNG